MSDAYSESWNDFVKGVFPEATEKDIEFIMKKGPQKSSPLFGLRVADCFAQYWN